MRNAFLKHGFIALGVAVALFADAASAAGTAYYVVKPVSARQGTPTGPVTPEISLLAGSLPAAKRGKPYAFDLKGNARVKGGPGIDAAQFLIYDGVLPQGLSLTNGGRLEGIPTTVTAPTSVDFSVRGTYVGALAEQSFAIRVDESYLDATKIVIGLQVGRIVSHVCAITPSGEVKCWGRSYQGSLGDGGNGISAVPVTVPGTRSTMVAAGQAHTCSVNTSGGAECWGTGDIGQLGNGTFASSSSPVPVTGLSAGVSKIVSGARKSCALTTVGRVLCWGEGSGVPVEVPGLSSGVAQISMGSDHVCVVTVAGAARCFGGNGYGQLGDGSTTSSATPVDVVGLGSGVASISAGVVRTCAVTTAGAAKCWGTAPHGNGSNSDSSLPVDVQGLGAGVRQISVGGHACAVNTAGQASCWGANGSGQLGDGSITNSFVPVDVHGLSVSGAGRVPVVHSIAAGSNNTCVILTASDGVWCWGLGTNGALGNGSLASSVHPVRVLD